MLKTHGEINQEQGLYQLSEFAGKGLVLFHHYGSVMRGVIRRYLETSVTQRGYRLVTLPHLMKDQLWVTSGHRTFFTDNMFFASAGEESETGLVVKPMNCPGHILVFKEEAKRSPSLPKRYFGFATVYRHEKIQNTHGLMRLRGFTQDDGHIFCTMEQLQQEVTEIVDTFLETLGRFGFQKDEDFRIKLATRPAKSLGDDDAWSEALTALRTVLEAKKLRYDVEEGAGAFYGPKIDFEIRDAKERWWQCSTVQVDFFLPRRFELADGIVMVHRAVLGSFERFLALYIEKVQGFYPLWLSPIQVLIIPVRPEHVPATQRLFNELQSQGIRAEIDARKKSLAKRIKDAESQPAYFIAVVGDQEMGPGTLTIHRRGHDAKETMSLEELVRRIGEESRGQFPLPALQAPSGSQRP